MTGRRPDGYHLLDAEMVSVDLTDELTFGDPPAGTTPGSYGDLEIVQPDDGAPSDRFDIPTGGDNLVVRALRAVGRQAHVKLVKRIPPGGGLGGGSSDAAAVLRWAGCEDLELAATLGADVPFCLRGGRAQVSGIGEQVTELPYVEQTFTLVTPPFGCSTPAVYRAWDDLGGPSGAGANDLQAAALTVEPRLAAWQDDLAQATDQEPILAGSGSTWFVEGSFPGEGRTVVRTLPSTAPARVV